MTCYICGRTDAAVRESERDVAAISGRAHVDCPGGHSQYRAVIPEDVNPTVPATLKETP